MEIESLNNSHNNLSRELSNLSHQLNQSIEERVNSILKDEIRKFVEIEVRSRIGIILNELESRK